MYYVMARIRQAHITSPIYALTENMFLTSY